MHRQNPPVIHRDLKPANIKITPEGRAVLVDFGIAKTYDPVLKTTLGARAVTPGYSPIEQYGTGVTDARTDLYSLGATLYTLLTGHEPPEAPQRVLRDPLISPRQLNPAISPALEGRPAPRPAGGPRPALPECSRFQGRSLLSFRRGAGGEVCE